MHAQLGEHRRVHALALLAQLRRQGGEEVPRRSWMITNVTSETSASVGIMISSRRIMKAPIAMLPVQDFAAP